MSSRTVSAITAVSSAKAEVLAFSDYLPHASINGGEEFIFSYEIIVRNLGDVSFRLLSRFWQITDDNGNVRRVSGDGVVGKQPRLAPNTAFQYTSYVDMPTPAGFMYGVYTMQLDNGNYFDVSIPCFSLIVPSIVH